MGLVDFAELPPDEARDALVANNRRLARYQRKWMRRIPGLIAVDANRRTGRDRGRRPRDRAVPWNACRVIRQDDGRRLGAVLREVRLRALARFPEAFLDDAPSARRSSAESHWRERATPSDTQASLSRATEGAGMVSCFVADDPGDGLPRGDVGRAASCAGPDGARELVEHVVDWAREHGAARVCLSVELGNDARARLYEKCGFVETSDPPPFPYEPTPGQPLLRVRALTMERWHALGNVYLVAEEALDRDRVRAEVGDADGIVEVTARGDDWAEVVIWNPDGSTAEMSGNATRIVAAWLGAERDARPRRRRARSSRAGRPDGQIEQELGEVEVSAPEKRRRPRGDRRSTSATRTRSSSATRTTCRGSGRCSRRIRASRSGRTCRSRASTGPARVTARVWERGVGETSASGTSAVAVAAATHGDGDVVVSFPGGELSVRLEGGRAWLTGRPSACESRRQRRTRTVADSSIRSPRVVG